MMDRIVFGQYTVQDLLIGAGSKHIQAVECTGCGWQGQVSRYAGRCPVCNTPLGEQKAEPGR
ncbi:MAG: hypothetical protein JRJ47_01745 [Deltaproteobacteria bacterium]|nr:hypothetical protein [Deltaproteobacteria bacterium]